MAAGAVAQLGQGGAHLRRRLPARDILPVRAMALQHLERNEQLAARGMDGKRQSSPAIAWARPAWRRARRCSGARAPSRICAASAIRLHEAPSAIGLELGERRHRLVVEIEAARIDQRREPLRRQPVAGDGRGQRRRDRMGRDLAAPVAAEHIAPPLQPDLARHGSRMASRTRATSTLKA